MPTLAPRLASLLALVVALGCQGTRERPSSQARPSSDAGVPAVDAGAVVNTPCTTGADCSAGVCDRASGRCVACRVSDECAPGQICEGGRCAASAACGSDLDCTPMGQVCDGAGGRCVACNTAADCGEGPCLGHSCLDNPACTSSLECADLRMVCAQALPPAWPESYGGQGCAECGGANDCAAREACRGGLCVDACAGRICGVVDGAACGTCAGGATCTADGRACISVLDAQFEAEQGIVVDGVALVWSDGRSVGAPRLWSVDLAGTGQAHLLTLGAQAEGYLDGVALAGGKVFAAYTDGGLYSAELQGRLTRFGGVPGQQTSTSVWCQGLAGHAAYVVCALVDYDETVPSGLYRIPVDGQPAALIDGIVQPSGLFVVGEEVFWSDFNGAMVGKSGLLSGQRMILNRVQSDLLGVEGGFAYYVTTDGELWRVPTAGGSAQPVASNLTRPRLLGLSPEGLLLSSGAEAGVLYEADLDGGNLRVAVDFGDALPVDPSTIIAVQRVGGDLFVITRYGVGRISR